MSSVVSEGNGYILLSQTMVVSCMNGQPGQIIDILENFAFENDDHP